MAGGKIYWTDWDTDKIQRANLDGSSVEDLATTGLSRPSGIALDVAGRKIYWTDSGTDKIQRANLDGSSVEDLVTTGLSRPSGIALGFVLVEAGPDLVVRASVSDNTLTPGQLFTLSVTVWNQGTEQTAATTLSYYRSFDLTISPGDRLVGTAAVGALAAAESSTESIRLTTESSGTYDVRRTTTGRVSKAAAARATLTITAPVRNPSPSLGVVAGVVVAGDVM